jgi:hypothetical protein
VAIVATDVTEQPAMTELLRRHRPLLRFDAQEPYLAISAESIVVNPGNRLLRGKEVLAVVGEDGTGLALADLAGPGQPQDGDRLDEGQRYLGDARRLQADAGLAERAYGRAVRDDPWLWLQYWFWEYYNPKHLLGFGRHEGDWELIQIGLDEDRVPRVATYAQHNGAAGCDWEELEHHEDEEGVHPVVYVAPFSHASYFEARTHWHPGGPDTPDGNGPAYLPRLERFQAWGEWPGRWGASTGVLAKISGGRLGGRSPSSPGAQKGRWDHPTRFHEKARRKRPFGLVDRALWTLGRRTYPLPPRITAELHGTDLRGAYALKKSLLRRPTQIYLTAHDPAQEGRPVLCSTAIPVEGSEGTWELELPRAPERCLVRASAFNRVRQRSDPAELVVEQS